MIKKNNMILRKVYYVVTVLSVLILLGGIFSQGIESLSFLAEISNFDYLTIGIPFGIWAWLIIVGLLFIKKNRVVIAILIALSIPNIIAIALLYAYSYSISEILKWYVMILSFGSIIII